MVSSAPHDVTGTRPRSATLPGLNRGPGHVGQSGLADASPHVSPTNITRPVRLVQSCPASPRYAKRCALVLLHPRPTILKSDHAVNPSAAPSTPEASDNPLEAPHHRDDRERHPLLGSLKSPAPRPPIERTKLTEDTGDVATPTVGCDRPPPYTTASPPHTAAPSSSSLVSPPPSSPLLQPSSPTLVYAQRVLVVPPHSRPPTPGTDTIANPVTPPLIQKEVPLPSVKTPHRRGGKNKRPASPPGTANSSLRPAPTKRAKFAKENEAATTVATFDARSLAHNAAGPPHAAASETSRPASLLPSALVLQAAISVDHPAASHLPASASPPSSPESELIDPWGPVRVDYDVPSPPHCIGTGGSGFVIRAKPKLATSDRLGSTENPLPAEVAIKRVDCSDPNCYEYWLDEVQREHLVLDELKASSLPGKERIVMLYDYIETDDAACKCSHFRTSCGLLANVP